MRKELLEYNFTRHCPTNDQIERYDTIRNKFREVAELVSKICPDSREKDQSIVNIEQAMFWANASIARNEACQEQ